MMFIEIAAAVRAGAESNQAWSQGAGWATPATVREHRVQRFRRQILVTLGSLPDDMTVAELREQIEETGGASDVVA